MKHIKLYEQYNKEEWLTKYDLPSDNIRYYYIQKALYSEEDNSILDIKKLTDTWDGYDDLVFVKKQGDIITFYEGFVPECWKALYMKDEYKGLSKSEAVEKMVNERFRKIANDLNIEILDYIFNGYYLKINFKVR